MSAAKPSSTARAL